MAKVNRKETEIIRNDYLKEIFDYFNSDYINEEIFQIASNKLCIPVVGEEGGEYFLTITLAVPTGERNGEPFDGYAEKESWELKVKDKAIREKEKKEKKKG